MSVDPISPQFRELGQDRMLARKQHLVAELSPEATAASSRRRLPRSRWAIVVVIAALFLMGTAIAATADWLKGDPAPQAVVTDFGSYAPQLGFDPEPGRAVLVAKDGDITLYATTNKQGGYCLIASAPWKRPSNLADGGTCLLPSAVTARLIAGVVGSSGTRYLVAGRTTDPEARTIRFTDPGGRSVSRPIGSSGFFVASVDVPGELCPGGGWTPAFTLIGADGLERSRTTITLGTSRSPGACTLATPHS